jgi:hypothetical protein
MAPKSTAVNAQKNSNKENGVRVRCIWTDIDDRILVRVLKDEKDAGNQSGAGWKAQVWTKVDTVLKEESVSKGPVKTASKISDHWTNVSVL